MRYVFDASAIVNLIKNGDLRVLSEGLTLDLALYESLNALYKEHAVLKRLDSKMVDEYVDILLDLFEVLEVKTMRGLEREVFENAIKHGLTIYDSSYFTLAQEEGLILVTDDRKLRKRVGREVTAIPTSELKA